MARRNLKNIFLFSFVILLFAFLFLLWGRISSPVSAGKYDAFAKCLATKGVIMYGADWCPHCQNEKKAFGSSFKYVDYVECPKEPQRCIRAGINGYPTWIFADGGRLEGEQGLKNLAESSGCTLP